MRAVVQKWGNSLAIRLPKRVAEDVRLRERSEVEMDVVDGRVVVTPVNVDEPSIEELIASIDPETVHPETDWGPPLGKEVW
ncbi:MAG: AbrB/MazE/SpoVT family DNA-binding domain-containing protein [Dehalococcoidia bacterium]